ncbi:MAG: D-alanine--D-alanine ligase [Deltaproteobacteria bacterium]|nr:D-alanine--D-alanine ligase [Deltaproteobacteria bacterium]
MWKDKRVAVLLGGPSTERDVSLRSGAACAAALRRKAYDVVEIDVGWDLASRLVDERIDVVFNILHGKYGEDGCVQGICELLRIPYTGSGVLASAAAMDKVATKAILAAESLPVAPHRILTHGARFEQIADAFPLPWVVKPATEGSSVGISIVTRRDAFAVALSKALAYDRRVMVEPYIKGREMSVGVLDARALGIVEIIPKSVEGEEISFYDYTHKYTAGMTEYVTSPENFDPAAKQRAYELAERACTALGVEGGARVDFIYSEAGEFVVIEINTLPGMTELSLLPMTARDGAGLSFDDLVEKMLAGARLKMGQ